MCSRLQLQFSHFSLSPIAVFQSSPKSTTLAAAPKSSSKFKIFRPPNRSASVNGRLRLRHRAISISVSAGRSSRSGLLLLLTRPCLQSPLFSICFLYCIVSHFRFFFAVSSRLQRKENLTPVGSKIAELNESRVELLTRIQGLKQDLHTWRSKLDTQIKVYREELTEVKKSLNDEVEQLRLEFKELRTTLQQQQDDISSSMKNLGPVDGGEDEVKEAKHSEADVQQEDEAKVLTVEEEPSSA